MAFDPSGCAAPVFVPQSCKDGEADEFDETPELRSALAGDEAAFTALYRRHRATVYRFVWLLTGSAAQAADITQDVFIELLVVRADMTQRVDRSPRTCAALHAFGRIEQWIRACNPSTISMR